MRKPRGGRELVEAIRAALVKEGYILAEPERIEEVLLEQPEPIAAE